jgi:hypothetical protein
MVSIARIERPQLYRGGSASTETMLAVSPLSLPSSLVSPSRNGTHDWFYCARRARPFLGRALLEQGTNMSVVPHLFASGGGQFNSAWRPQ